MTTTVLSRSPEMVAHRVVVVGMWRSARRRGREWAVHSMNIHSCPDLKDLRYTVNAMRPGWLLLGQDLDDYDLQAAVSTGRAACPNLRFAILGSDNDWRRCESWLRRGCDAYLDASSNPRHVAQSLRFAGSLNVCVVDRVFHQLLRSRRLEPLPNLTRRESEVLGLLMQGLGNRDIASILHVTENTIEYHMRHLLLKLGARSRLEAVQRATSFGLA
jgi:DNA-binding NarL/FixJ family response regulator